MTELQNFETPMETARRERREAIVKEYKDEGLKLIAKGLKPYRVMMALAQKYNMSLPGIRLILTESGEYKGSKEVRELAKNLYPTA